MGCFVIPHLINDHPANYMRKGCSGGGRGMGLYSLGRPSPLRIYEYDGDYFFVLKLIKGLTRRKRGSWLSWFCRHPFPISKCLLVLPACQKMMLPHILSVLLRFQSFMRWICMYCILFSYLNIGKTGASILTSYWMWKWKCYTWCCKLYVKYCSIFQLFIEINR